MPHRRNQESTLKSFVLMTLATTLSTAAMAQEVTKEAICYAAGIGAGNIAGYKERVFDQKPEEAMQALFFASANLKSQPRHLQQKVDLAVIGAASIHSWPSVLRALKEFNKICPCGGQSPCSMPVTNPQKVN